IPEGAKTAPVIGLWAFVGAYAFMSVGEVLISPVYMAVITRLAPRRQQATWQGAVLLAIGILGFGTSRIGAYAERDGGVHRVETFMWTGAIALAIVVVFAMFSPFLVRLVQRYNPQGDPVLADELQSLNQLDANEPAIGVRVDKRGGPK
ncbi:MAG: hypothetical protein HOO04_03260, partial [Phycisphaerae bacterium]|nr:hypothetical protein [Phycisphaerae bacterium]